MSKTTKTIKKPTKKIGAAQITQIQDMAAQGDVLFRRVAQLPTAGLTDITPNAKGSIVVAHSETGHHHSIDDVSGMRFFRVDGDPLTCYLAVEGLTPAVVTHHRPHDTHAPVSLTPGVWQVKRQREYVPGGWRRVED